VLGHQADAAMQAQAERQMRLDATEAKLDRKLGTHQNDPFDPPLDRDRPPTRDWLTQHLGHIVGDVHMAYWACDGLLTWHVEAAFTGMEAKLKRGVFHSPGRAILSAAKKYRDGRWR
jgi:hypothetical protein